ncbi:MAG TPA: hypothetical protein ENF21_09140 [Bacteroidetes bacterium]|nr:hypothetical protein [Bacteroidota bacterium]
MGGKRKATSGLPEYWLVVAMGFTSMSAQLILLRDFLKLFQGNELVIGLLLASWMFITAVGAWTGYRFRRLHHHLALLFLVLAWLPPLTHFLLVWLRYTFFTPGVMTGLLPVLVFSWTVLLPFCFVSGMSFPVFSGSLSERAGSNHTNRIYYLEASGSLAGGALFSFVLVFLFPHWAALFLILLLNMGVLATVAWRTGRRKILGWSVASMAVTAFFLLFTDPGKLENRWLFPGQQVVMQQESPYGSLTLTRMHGQWQLYENNEMLYSTGIPALQEEKVHYPLSQHPRPDTLLLVFGSWNGMLQEISKYGPAAVDAVEINPELVEMLQSEFPEISASWLAMHFQDPVIFVNRAKDKRYDAILVNAPPPDNLQTNRYFTREFFLRCRELLSPGGVFSISLPASGNYLGESARKNHSILYFTLKEVFPYVTIVPGEEDYFIASAREFDWDITGLITEKGLENDYMNPWYISNDLIRRRADRIVEALTPDIRLNTGLYPVATFTHWKQWLSHFDWLHSLVPLIFMLFILLTLVRMNPVQVVLFAGGFASAALEVILLLAFQVLFGYLYLATGMLITVFMLGLYLGSRTAEYRKGGKEKPFTRPLVGLATILAAMPVLIFLLKNSSLNAILVPVFIGSITLLTAFLVGTLFARGTRLLQKDIFRSSGRLYSADLMGSALGAMLVSAVLIPLTGIIVTCFLTAGVALAGMAWYRYSSPGISV